MHTTKLIPHKGDNCIAVAFEKKLKLITCFKKINGAKESVTCDTAHPLENGTGLRFIHGLSGHNSSKTI